MAAIKERIDNVTEDVTLGKVDISSAITDKGVDTTSGDSFATMANNIRLLDVNQTSDVIITTKDNIVTMTCDTPNATIYYRVSGSSTWNVYSSPISITETVTYEAYSRKIGQVKGNIITKECIFKQAVEISSSSANSAFTMTGFAVGEYNDGENIGTINTNNAPSTTIFARVNFKPYPISFINPSPDEIKLEQNKSITVIQPLVSPLSKQGYTIGFEFENDITLYAYLIRPAKRIKVTGAITDENNEPMIGVYVVSKLEPTYGTTSNFDGLYELTNVIEGDTLIFSYLGYQTQEIKVPSSGVLNVKLLPE